MPGGMEPFPNDVQFIDIGEPSCKQLHKHIYLLVDIVPIITLICFVIWAQNTYSAHYCVRHIGFDK